MVSQIRDKPGAFNSEVTGNRAVRRRRRVLFDMAIHRGGGNLRHPDQMYLQIRQKKLLNAI